MRDHCAHDVPRGAPCFRCEMTRQGREGRTALAASAPRESNIHDEGTGTVWILDTSVLGARGPQWVFNPHGKGMTPWCLIRCVDGEWQAGLMHRWETTWLECRFEDHGDAILHALNAAAWPLLPAVLERKADDGWRPIAFYAARAA